jgi:hypothetical protein
MATIDGNYLINKGKSFKIRYMTASSVVCDTDELFGKFGDEFPIQDIKG